MVIVTTVREHYGQFCKTAFLNDPLNQEIFPFLEWKSQRGGIPTLLTFRANISVSNSWCFLSRFPAEAKSLAWSFMASSVSAWEQNKQESCQVKAVFKKNKISNCVPKLFPKRVKEIIHAYIWLSDKHLLSSHTSTPSRCNYLWQPELKIPDACVEPLLATSLIELLPFVSCSLKQVVPVFLQLFQLTLTQRD